MARTADKNRLKKMEAVAIELIADKGYSSTSVSEIAKRAGISAGYLYTCYKSKEQLALSIYEKHISEFDDYIDSIIRSSSTIREFAIEFVEYIFLRTNESPLLVRFLLLLVFDRNFNIPALRLDKTREQCGRILQKGVESGEIRSDCTPEDIYIVYFSIPLKFIENRLDKCYRPRQITGEDALRVAELCIKALR